MRVRRSLLLLVPTMAAVVTPTVLALTHASAAAPVAATSAAAPVVVALPAALEMHPTVLAAQAAPRRTAVRPVTVVHPVAHRIVVKAAAKPIAKPVVKTVQVAAPAAPAPAPAAAPAPVTTQTAGTDDYPYRTATTNASDPWGFTERQCVSFAAWRLSQHGHALNNAQQNWGSALTWDDTARKLGMAVSSTPTVGAVAQWNADESSPFYAPGSSTANGTFTSGGYGHVGWVKAVYADGSALVEQYNMGGNRSYSVMRVKAPRYLHIG